MVSKLEVCVFDHLDTRNEPLAKLYADRLAFAEAVEAAGLDGYYVAEHHSTPLGHASSPSVFIAALTQRTKRMRIGSMVHVLPAYVPLRLAEEICMLDHLSNGRLDIGVGRGASPYEVGFFGVVPQEARDIFEEALAVIKMALTHDTLSHRGAFFKYYDVPLTLRPLQVGGPPLWYGAFSERNVDFAARHALNITLSGPPKRLRQLSEHFRQVWSDQNPDAAPPKIATMYQMFIASTTAEAETIAEKAYKSWYACMGHLWRANNAAPRETLPDSFAGAMKLGSMIAGTPDTVREKLQGNLDASGLTRLLLQCNMGTMSHQDALNSLALFKSDVMPHLSVSAAAPSPRVNAA